MNPWIVKEDEGRGRGSSREKLRFHESRKKFIQLNFGRRRSELQKKRRLKNINIFTKSIQLIDSSDLSQTYTKLE